MFRIGNFCLFLCFGFVEFLPVLFRSTLELNREARHWKAIFVSKALECLIFLRPFIEIESLFPSSLIVFSCPISHLSHFLSCSSIIFPNIFLLFDIHSFAFMSPLVYPFHEFWSTAESNAESEMKFVPSFSTAGIVQAIDILCVLYWISWISSDDLYDSTP